MSEDALRLVVIGDSTAFTDHEGPQLPDHPALYPNVTARHVEEALGRPVAVSVLARPGQTVRDAHRLVTKDRHAQFEVLAGADAVVVGVCSFDHAPGGVPAAVEALVPFLRPAPLRRAARRALRAAYPRIVRATGGRLRRTPPAEFSRLYDGLLLVVRGLTQGAAGVALGPTSHRSPYYGGDLHPRRETAERSQFAIAERHGFATVPVWPLVEPHLDRLNPDGIHWPHAVHAAVGEEVGRRLVAQLRGELAGPAAPSLPTTPGVRNSHGR